MIDPKKIGGSDSAALVGLSRYKRPIDVWRRMVEGHEQPQTPPMWRGLELEPYVRTIYQRETGARLLGPRNCEFPGRPFLRASLDDVAERDGDHRVVELKTAHWRMAQEWGDGEVPAPYLCQVQWYMRAANLPRADLAVLFSVDDFRLATVEADDELQEMLLEAATRFWVDHVVPRRPPPVDGSDSYAKFLAAKFPAHLSPLAQASPAVEEMARELRAEKELVARTEVEIGMLENAIKEAIGTAEGVEGSFGRITWRRSKDSTKTDWEAVAREMGAPAEVVAKHTITKPGPRVFRPTWAKEQP